MFAGVSTAGTAEATPLGLDQDRGNVYVIHNVHITRWGFPHREVTYYNYVHTALFCVCPKLFDVVKGIHKECIKPLILHQKISLIHEIKFIA